MLKKISKSIILIFIIGAVLIASVLSVLQTYITNSNQKAQFEEQLVKVKAKPHKALPKGQKVV